MGGVVLKWRELGGWRLEVRGWRLRVVADLGIISHSGAEDFRGRHAGEGGRIRLRLRKSWRDATATDVHPPTIKETVLDKICRVHWHIFRLQSLHSGFPIPKLLMGQRAVLLGKGASWLPCGRTFGSTCNTHGVEVLY